MLSGMEILVLQPGQRTILPAISGSALSCMSQEGHLNFTVDVGLEMKMKNGNLGLQTS